VISFRYHIVSIVSVFLALAVGVALGGGPLKGEVDNSLVEQVEADRQVKAQLQSEIAGLRSGNAFTDDFARTAAPGIVGGELDGRPVTVVALPGAQEVLVTATADMVQQAGGNVAGIIRTGDGLVDPGNKQLVDELGSQLLDGTPDVTVDDEASGYERLGALLARAVATDEDGGDDVDDAASSILSGLSTAGLMSPADDFTRRGSLVVFVSGPGGTSSDDEQGAGAIVAALARSVDSGSDGVVVAGPVTAAQQDGVVAGVRRDVVAARDVSTVDSLGRVAGQVVTVLALAEQADGSVGHYGAEDAADGAMPGASTEE
jgi:hypothetical protein